MRVRIPLLIPMLIISLILLLLSNIVTLRHEKSILYSRATITILIIAGFICYDKLYFLFLNRGIGIFARLFGSILLISSTIVLFIFYLRLILFLIYPYITKEIPRVHSFTNTPLHSTILPDKNSLEAHAEKCKMDLKEASEDLKGFLDAVKLDKMLKETKSKARNRSMEELMEHYESFFDEESGNTKQQGLRQVHEELYGDYKLKKNEYNEALKKLSEFKENSLIPFTLSFHFNGVVNLLRYILPFITLVLSTISLILYFFPTIQLEPYIPEFFYLIIIYIQSIVKYEIIVSLPLFLWSSYSYLARVKKLVIAGNKLVIAGNKLVVMLHSHRLTLSVKSFYFNSLAKIIKYVNISYIVLSVYICLSIGFITFMLALFIFIPESLLNIANILALILFNL